MIIKYVKEEIEKNYLQSKKHGIIGKFILKNYPKEFYETLINSISNDEILFVSDKDLDIKKKNFKKVKKAVLAQYRNENVENDTLENIFYIVFITNSNIDTLNDLATLNVDDIKNNLLELIENINFREKKELKEFFKLFLKEFEEATVFEIEKFINEIIKNYQSGSALNRAIGERAYFTLLNVKNVST